MQFPRAPGSLIPATPINAVSAAGQVRLLEMSCQRLFSSIFTGPPIALAFVLFYQMHHSAQWLWPWLAGYCAFVIAAAQIRRTFRAEQATQDPATLLARWRPRMEYVALAQGIGVASPMVLVAGNVKYEIALLMVAHSGGIVAAAAAMQTPTLSIFQRFFAAGWCASIMLHPWLLPQHWIYSLPIAVLYSFIVYRQARNAHHFFVHQVWLEEQGQQLAQRYREARDDAEAALAEKNRFLRTAAHDLRQPVHAIALLTEAIAMRNQDASLVAPLTDLRTNLRSMHLLFDSLLDLSRIESGQVAARPQPLALGVLFTELQIQFTPMARARQLQLRMRPPPHGATVMADAAMLRQSLINLVHNALRYTVKGGVLVGARKRGSQWRIEVWDTGLGVATEDQARIYQPFFRPEQAWNVNRTGYGLGLAVVERCAALMQAQHGLRSRPGQGSCFWLQLPSTTASPARHNIPQGAPFAATPLRGSVLVLDDDPHVLHAWLEVLGSWGLHAHGARDAHEAMAVLDQGVQPDVILCDQRLRSGESGYEIFRALLERCPHARGAMVTGEFNMPELMEAEAEGYLILKKPVDVSELHALLKRWLAPATLTE